MCTRTCTQRKIARIIYIRACTQTEIVKIICTRTWAQAEIVKIIYTRTCTRTERVKINYTRTCAPRKRVKANSTGTCTKLLSEWFPRKRNWNFHPNDKSYKFRYIKIEFECVGIRLQMSNIFFKTYENAVRGTPVVQKAKSNPCHPYVSHWYHN